MGQSWPYAAGATSSLSSAAAPSDGIGMDRISALPDDLLRDVVSRLPARDDWIFPDTAALAHRGTDVVFPLLKEFIMSHTYMEEEDLQHMLVCSPKLEILGLVLSTMPQCICLHSPSLQCMLLWMSVVEELTVVDAPRLERLILWRTCAESDDDFPMVVKIDRASELRVLGYLDLRVHQLHIGNGVINAQTKPRPSCIVASVKILALKVNLGVYEDVNMLPSFLKCFPNVETLHIESSILGETTGMGHAKFWRKVQPFECLKSHVKKIVIHEFQGEPSEFEFLKFIAMCAGKLQFLVLVLTKEKYASTDEVDEVNRRLEILFASPWLWAAEEVNMVLLGSEIENSLSFPKASDLSVNDPFLRWT